MKYEFDFRKRKKKRIILKNFSMRNRFIRNIDKDLRIEDVENIWNDLIQNMILILYLKSINFVFFFRRFSSYENYLDKNQFDKLVEEYKKKEISWMKCCWKSKCLFGCWGFVFFELMRVFILIFFLKSN